MVAFLTWPIKTSTFPNLAGGKNQRETCQGPVVLTNLLTIEVTNNPIYSRRRLVPV